MATKSAADNAMVFFHYDLSHFLDWSRHHYLEDSHRPRLALDHDVAQRADVVVPFEPDSGCVANDNAGLVVLIQRFEPRAEVHVVADHGVAHD